LFTAAVLTVLAAPVAAQSNGDPAEFPPSTFSGNQYVDSEGCAFIRAGISGITNWVPRVDRTRTQLCNFQPTFAAAAPQAAPTPVVAPVVTATAAPAPAPASNVGAPIETVASLPRRTVRAPIVQAPTRATAQVAQAPVRAPAPRAVRTPAPISMAQACEGRFGVQAGFVSRTTGAPIDCGPAPRAARAEAPQAAQPRRMTLADACAQMARTGSVLIDAATSRPIACPSTRTIATATAPSIAVPAAPSAPSNAAAPAAPTTAQLSQSCGGAITHMRTANGGLVRCGPQGQLPYTIAGTQNPTVTSRAKTPAFANAFRQPEVPASNPVAAAGTVRKPAGYQNVWNDGRLNPNRGLPQTQATAPRAQSARAPKQGHHFVQVGTFGDHNNAARLGQQLAGMGLPVGIVNRGAMKMVVSGPFNDPSALQQALATVRGMGFSDAYTRN